MLLYCLVPGSVAESLKRHAVTAQRSCVSGYMERGEFARAEERCACNSHGSAWESVPCEQGRHHSAEAGEDKEGRRAEGMSLTGLCAVGGSGGEETGSTR
eukprot:2647786-Rhodomonas_salina.3